MGDLLIVDYHQRGFQSHLGPFINFPPVQCGSLPAGHIMISDEDPLRMELAEAVVTTFISFTVTCISGSIASRASRSPSARRTLVCPSVGPDSLVKSRSLPSSTVT